MALEAGPEWKVGQVHNVTVLAAKALFNSHAVLPS